MLLLATACAGVDASSDLTSRRLLLVPELRIGSVDDAETALTYFRGLEVGPDGRIFTVHPEENRIRIHDAEGRPAGFIGGPGEGPGEFRNVGMMGWVGDSLWVLDFGNYRFSYFDVDGGLLHSRTIPINLGGAGESSPPRPEGLLPDGTIFGSPPAWSREVAKGTITERVVLRLDERSMPLDTLFRQPLRNTTWAIEDPNSTRGFGSYGAQPFSDTEMVQFGPSGSDLVTVERRVPTTADGASFRVSRISLAGDTLFSREISYAPTPIDPVLVDSLVRMRGESMGRIAARMPGAPTPARAEELARASLYLPAFHPPVSQLLVGRDGSIWLQREVVNGETADWLVLSPAGGIAGTLSAPRRMRILAAEERRIWGMETDELDVPYIVRYRVEEEEAT